MTSTHIINRTVVGGRTLTDPITKRVTTKTGETTVTTFLLGVSGERASHRSGSKSKHGRRSRLLHSSLQKGDVYLSTVT